MDERRITGVNKGYQIQRCLITNGITREFRWLLDCKNNNFEKDSNLFISVFCIIKIYRLTSLIWINYYHPHCQFVCVTLVKVIVHFTLGDGHKLSLWKITINKKRKCEQKQDFNLWYVSHIGFVSIVFYLFA